MTKMMVIVLLVGSCLFAQTGTASITARKLVPFDQLTINDFDFLGTGNTNRFLEFSGSADPGVNGFLEVLITKDDKSLLSMRTLLIRNPNGFSFRFDNSEIKDGFNITDNNGESFDVEIDGDPEIDEDLIDLGSGLSTKLPDGFYEITANVWNETNNTLLDTYTLSFTLESNRQIDVIAPFDGSEITSIPRFEWSTTNTYHKFVFVLHEGLSGGSTNLDGKQIAQLEFKEGEDFFRKRTFDLNDTEFSSIKALLEVGKTYVWYVYGTYYTTSGEQEVNSTLNKFTYTDARESGNSDALDAILLSILKGNYESVKKEFDGMSFESLKINGDDKTIRELQQFINGLDLSGKIIIVETL